METKNSPYDKLYIYELSGTIDETIDLGPNSLGIWNEEGTLFLFFNQPSKERISELIETFPNLRLIDSHKMTYRQWQGGEDLVPISIPPFRIIPYWNTDNFSIKEGELPIIIDPGVVFGHGGHPTTIDSLKALAYLYKEKRYKRILDLGCGTGILSIAAGLLGAEEIMAVDKVHAAVEITKKNLARNGLENISKVWQQDVLELEEINTDLILANISFEVLKRLLKKGLFNVPTIISGLLRSQGAYMEELLRNNNYIIRKKFGPTSGWHTFWIEPYA